MLYAASQIRNKKFNFAFEISAIEKLRNCHISTSGLDIFFKLTNGRGFTSENHKGTYKTSPHIKTAACYATFKSRVAKCVLAKVSQFLFSQILMSSLSLALNLGIYDDFGFNVHHISLMFISVYAV